MKCVWSAFINVLPIWMRQEVDRLGKNQLLELRMRLGLPPELVTLTQTVRLERLISAEDIKFCVNVASQYSPWASVTASQGYITIEGGHRVGFAGQVVDSSNGSTVFRRISSLCIRVAREFPTICKDIWRIDGSILIIGRPGSGKTTLLRDLITQKSDKGELSVSVIDERGELLPYCNETPCFYLGSRTDVISGKSKAEGATMAIRNLTPDVLAFDEITAPRDCDAMLKAGWCGIKLIATAHAGSKEDLVKRPLYRPIVESALFDTLVIMRPDKSWSVERMIK